MMAAETTSSCCCWSSKFSLGVARHEAGEVGGKGQGSGGLGVACYGGWTSSQVIGSVEGFPSRYDMARFVHFRQTTLVVVEDRLEGEISVHSEGYSNLSRILK